MEADTGQQPKPGRNLIMCIDGTSNQFGAHNTNVIELYSQIVTSDTQLTYYNSGIGTYAKPSWKSPSYWKQGILNKIDLAIAWNFQKTVLSAYHWLSENYQDNDRIFLFGFSRDAYQVRTIAGMIKKVGLIRKGNQEQIPFAYELYMDPESKKYKPPQEWTYRQHMEAFLRLLRFQSQRNRWPNSDEVDLAKRFKSTFSRPGVRVHFIGVWDTVSSIGIVRGRDLPLTENIRTACYIRHALSLDERRVKFLPEYFHALPTNNMSDVPKVKEVWFPGSHSDIGGGNQVNVSLSQGGTPSFWMSCEAMSCGLKLQLKTFDWNWGALDDVEKSLTWGWRIFEGLPFKRLTYKNNQETTLIPHLGKGRKIRPGQKIHASIAFCKLGYEPKAQIHPRLDWKSIVGQGTYINGDAVRVWEDILEMDILNFEDYEEAIQRLRSDTKFRDLWLHRLRWMNLSSEGRAALIRAKAIPLLSHLFFPESTNQLELSTEQSTGLIVLCSLLATSSNESSYIKRKEMVATTLDIFTRVFGPQHLDTIDVKQNYACILGQCREFEEAKYFQEEVLKLRKDILGQLHPDTTDSMCELVTIYGRCGQLEEAEELGREVLRYLAEMYEGHHPHKISIMNYLADIFGSQSRFEDAEKFHREVLRLQTELHGTGHPATIDAMNNLSTSLKGLGRLGEAEKLYEKELTHCKQILGARHPQTIPIIHGLANIRRDSERLEEAESLCREALMLCKEILGSQHPQTILISHTLVNILRDGGHSEEAEKLEQPIPVLENP